MTGFTRHSQLAQADANMRTASFRKVANQITTIGIWFDMSMSPGYPSPKFWFDSAPYEAKQIKQSTDGGLWHGANVGPSKEKWLRKTMHMCATATPLPMPIMLLDYLLYYPTIGEDTTDEQFLVNTETLPRYTDGKGVQIMAVSVASRTGGQQFFCNYTNQDGVSGRITKTVIQNTVSVTGSIVSSDRANALAAGPFIPLQDGDSGVRSIESVTMLGPDVGLFSLLLVKPIAETMLLEITAPNEVDYWLDRKEITKIEDDAFLNYIVCPSGSLSAASFLGTLKTILN